MKNHLKHQLETDKNIVLAEIEYCESIQLSKVNKILKEYFEEKSMKNSEAVLKCFVQLSYLATSLKNPAFKEEGELRLVYVPTIKLSNGNYTVDDKIPGDEFIFIPKDQNIKVHFVFPLPKITSVYTGPRNIVDPLTLKVFLKTNGHDDVEILTSDASLR